MGMYSGRICLIFCNLLLVDPDECRDLVTHGIHGVMRLVAMDRPVADVLRVELVGAHRTDRDVDADLGPARLRPDAAAIGAGHLEIVAVHVDWMVRHRQVTDANTNPVVLGNDERIDPGKTRVLNVQRLKSVISMIRGTYVPGSMS